MEIEDKELEAADSAKKPEAEDSAEEPSAVDGAAGEQALETESSNDAGDEPPSDEPNESAQSQRETWLSGERLSAILESLLFAAGEPVTLTQLANALDDIPRDEIRKALGEMATGYASAGRGLMLEEIAGGYQLRTIKEHAPYVRRLLAAKPPRLSRPLLETLAIIAYRQPMTRAEIEQLRGVDTGGVLDTLVERSLVKIAGRKDGPGRPIIYATTQDFLELFGLKDLESLPDLQEFRELEATYQPENQPQPDGEVTEQAPSISTESEAAEASMALTSPADTPSDEAGENAEPLVAPASPPEGTESAAESAGQPGPSAKKDWG